MINIHTDLLRSVAEKIIDADDFFILLCLGKRIGKNNDSWPSVARLMSESNFGKNKVHTCISNLVKAGFIEKEQRRIEKKGTKQTILSTNLYTIKTDFLGVYLGAKGQVLEDDEEEKPVSHFEDTENETSENQTVSIKHSPLSINQSLEAGEKFSQNENSGSREFCVDTKKDVNTSSEESVNVEDKTNNNSGVSEKENLPPAARPSANKLQQPVLSDIDNLFNEFWEQYPRDIYGKKHGTKNKAKIKFAKLVKNNTTLAKKIIENVKEMSIVLDLCRKEDEEHKGEQYHANATFSIRRAEYYLDKQNQDFIAYERDWWDYMIKYAETKKSLFSFGNFLRGKCNKEINLTIDKNQNFSVDTTATYNPSDFNVDY